MSELEHFVGDRSFDCIIAGDILEHLDNPWGVIDLLFKNLSRDGQFVISLPNFAFWGTFVYLLKQKFPYHSRGIYDNTHKRFFMKKNMFKLIDNPHAQVRIAARNFRIRERGGGGRLTALLLGLICHIPYFKEFFVFQYLVVISIKTQN